MKIISIERIKHIEFDKKGEIKDIPYTEPTFDLVVEMTQEEYNEMVHALFKYREELLTKEKGD